ncbi:MAG: folate family ECF transporter S component [Clostridium sp.]|uniref:folate family ECF transporter S component n=1 Tax=Clostridium sp. TaxID=1506 RepID=UPI003034445A
MGIIEKLNQDNDKSIIGGKKSGITVKKIVYMAVFIAITAVLSRFFSIQLEIIKITFSFIPIALAAMIFGPAYGGLVAGIEDLLGATLFPRGPFFPGFTMSAIVVGVIYGIVLYKKPKTTIRFIVASTLIAILVHIGLNTVWLTILYDKGFIALASTRVVKALIMIPIEVIMLKLSWKYIGEKLEKTI